MNVPHLVSFGPFVLDRSAKVLTDEGTEVRLRPQIFELLLYLIDNRHRVVNKDEMAQVLSPEAHLGDSAITTCIAELRRALRDSAKEPLYIRTHTKTGCRFIAAVSEMQNAPSWNVPYKRNPFFTGRQKELEQLSRSLDSKRGVVQAIGGLPGVGKTHLVARYAENHRDDYEAVLWCEADSSHSLVVSYRGAAGVLNLPERDTAQRDQTVSAVRNWLGSHSHWLLVLENLEDLSLLKRFLPQDIQGHVLITTRLPATGPIAEYLQLDPMDAAEGARLLLRRSKIIGEDAATDCVPREERVMAEAVSTELGGLPLALDQAGAFIEEVPSTPSEYLTLYRAEGARLRARRGWTAAEHNSVRVTFSLAYAQVAARSAAAADLLRLCAFLAPTEIPEDFFLEAREKLGDHVGQITSHGAFLEVLEQARRFSLIERIAPSRSLNIHRVVQETLKDDMKEERSYELWLSRILEALDQAFPVPDYKKWRRCEELREHALKALEHESESLLLNRAALAGLSNDLGLYLSHRGEYRKAASLLETSVRNWKRESGQETVMYAYSLHNLAAVKNLLGRIDECGDLLSDALEIFTRATGRDSLGVAHCLNGLGAIRGAQGAFEEAAQGLEECLRIRTVKLGRWHKGVGDTLTNLGLVHLHAGRIQDAESVLQEALEILEREVDTGDPHLAHCLCALGETLEQQGRYAEAVVFYKRAVEIREPALKPTAGRQLDILHPDLTSAYELLGRASALLGRYDEAESLLRAALKTGGTTLNEALILSGLGNVLWLQGRPTEAWDCCQRAHAIVEAELDPGPLQVAAIYECISGVWVGLGAIEAAQRLCEIVVKIREACLGDSPCLARSLYALGANHLLQGSLDSAEHLLRRTLEIQKKTLGPSHLWTARTMNTFGGLLLRRGNLEEAGELLEAALSVNSQLLGECDQKTTQNRDRLGDVRFMQGRYEEAEMHYRKILQAIEQDSATPDRVRAQTLEKCAGALLGLGRKIEATMLFHQAEQIRS